jgi:outer membrane scaffolding protein for murein synthesis (MipA/OmpV family)
MPVPLFASAARERPPARQTGDSGRRISCRAAAILLSLALIVSLFAPAYAQVGDDATIPVEEEKRPVATKATEPVTAVEEDKALWEFGFAGGGGLIPDYPASDERGVNGLVFPFFVYRGGIFRLGEKGLVRGRVVKEEDLDIDFSLSGSFPVDSDDNEARRGMPDLDLLGELGPSVEWTFAHIDPNTRLKFELPLRAVFSTDFTDIDFRGFQLHPEIAYERKVLFGTRLSTRISAGPIFATERLHDYFYEVAPQFARADRPAFDSHGGYLGTLVSGSVSWKAADNLTVFFGIRAGIYDGAANRNSPLFRDEINFATGIGFAWFFWESEAREEN